MIKIPRLNLGLIKYHLFPPVVRKSVDRGVVVGQGASEVSRAGCSRFLVRRFSTATTGPTEVEDIIIACVSVLPLSICLCLPICLSVSVCLSLSVYLPICLSLSFSVPANDQSLSRRDYRRDEWCLTLIIYSGFLFDPI